MSAEVFGLDTLRVGRWLRDAVAVNGDLHFTRIAGGLSNLTYEVRDDGGHRWVLRRPPVGEVQATAHDMAREHRIISSLASSGVPVAKAGPLCVDVDVIGAPFFLMEFVDGLVVRTPQIAAALSSADRARIANDLVATLAKLHAVDPVAVGLGDLGRTENYLQRQLARWQRQVDQARLRDLPDMDRLREALTAKCPPQRFSGLVHGDYRLDNCIVGDGMDIEAVLDWELCTQGDQLADLGILLVYWSEPDDRHLVFPDSPSAAGGFPNRRDLVRTYEEVAGRRDLSIGFYVAFAYWRMACITEGLAYRHGRGALGGSDDAAVFSRQTDLLVAAGLEALAGFD